MIIIFLPVLVGCKLFLTVATDVLDFTVNIHGHQIVRVVTICPGSIGNFLHFGGKTLSF